MALLQRTRVLPNQRLDLPDYSAIESFICADFAAINKYVWSDSNYVFSGFEASGEGSGVLSVTLATASAVIGADEGLMYIGAPTLSPLQTSTLTPNAVNYVEIFIEQDTGGADSRSFWDQTAAGGAGGEFSQIVDTFIFNKASFAINTSNFTSDADKLPIAEVTVDSGGRITSIRDARPMFFRLGRPSNPGYTFNWSNGRSPENPTVPSYGDPDKIITHLKTMFDAIMDSIREIKGTTYWYEIPNTSLTGTMQNHSLSVLTGNNNTSKFSWTGTELLITDESPSGTPDSDTIAYLRIFNSLEDLALTRQDNNAPSAPLALSDGDVLWLEISDPLASTNYTGTGASLSNYRVSPRGSVPLDDTTYWIAFREGTRLYIRGYGELEAGETQQISDETSQPLQQFLGFDPETATSVPYTTFPNSLLFGNTFDSSSALVEAISANAANINGFGSILDEKAYEEHYLIVPGAPANDYELSGPVATSTIVSLPLDSRNGGAAKSYVVGEGLLHIYHDGAFLIEGVDWNEVGTAGNLSTQVEIIRDSIEVGEYLSFRIDSLGGFNVGAAGGGGDVIGASNIGGGDGEIFKQKTTGILELRTLSAGAGISITTSGDQIIIALTGGAPTPYFRNDISGVIGTSVNTGGPYNLGEDKLEAYRNGILMVNSLTIGIDQDRYQEGTNTTIILEPTAPATASEVFTFVNQDTQPSYRTQITGITGTTLTVPSYTQGDDSLRLFRNGVLMNSNGLGTVIDQYAETTTTSVTLGSAAITSDVFVVISGPVPSAREDKTGLVGTVITLTNSYSVGSGELLVYRNGVLMLNSLSLGIAQDQYQETTANSITLQSAALATEVFTFIIK